MPEGADWRIVALSQEVGEAPLGIKLIGADIVLFRDAQGRCRALSDHCAHRRTRLSVGSVTPEGLIECPYHGWRYDGATGACREIPNLSSEERVPKTYRVPVYPAIECDGFVLIWPVEDAAAAPPPTPSRVEVADKLFGRRLVAMPADLYIDALLDAPSAVLGWDGVGIVDDHRFGDPVVTGGHVRVAFAAGPDALLRRGVVADYPYIVAIEAPLGSGPLHLTLTDTAARLQTEIQLAVSPRHRCLTDVLWRAQGPLATRFSVMAAIDAVQLARAGDYVSGVRHAAGGAQAVSPLVTQER